MAKEVAKRLGVEFNTKYIDQDTKQFEFDSGSIDAIWNGFTITAEREKEVTFTKPYFDNHIVMMTLKGNTYKTFEDQKDKKVGIELQSSGQIALEQMTDIYDSISEMLKYTSVAEALISFKTKGIDVIVVDENYGIGFEKGSYALVERVDEILDEMIEEGTAGKISIDWFGEDMISRLLNIYRKLLPIFQKNLR